MPTVPPGVTTEYNMILLDVTAVVSVVMTPAVIAAVVPVMDAAPLEAVRRSLVPTVVVVPEAREVVVVRDPGVVIDEGNEIVAIPLVVETEI